MDLERIAEEILAKLSRLVDTFKEEIDMEDMEISVDINQYDNKLCCDIGISFPVAEIGVIKD